MANYKSPVVVVVVDIEEKKRHAEGTMNKDEGANTLDHSYDHDVINWQKIQVGSSKSVTAHIF